MILSIETLLGGEPILPFGKVVIIIIVIAISS